jgi:hypothetical protein
VHSRPGSFDGCVRAGWYHQKQAKKHLEEGCAGCRSVEIQSLFALPSLGGQEGHGPLDPGGTIASAAPTELTLDATPPGAGDWWDESG